MCMPSRADLFGIAYLEAWAYGKPVIGAQIGGIGDIISHNVDGLLVPFGARASLADALAELLASPTPPHPRRARPRQSDQPQHLGPRL